MLSHLIRFLREEDGPTAVEYAVMLALVIVVLMSAITAVGNSTAGVWSTDASRISTATS